jgi:hypothetical protein
MTMKRLLLLAGVTAGMTIAPLAMSAAGADPIQPRQSLNCNTGVNPGRISCTATDADGIARIRLTDSSGAVIKVLHFDCSAPVTDKTGFSFADDGGSHRVQILDCKGNTSSYKIPSTV